MTQLQRAPASCVAAVSFSRSLLILQSPSNPFFTIILLIPLQHWSYVWRMRNRLLTIVVWMNLDFDPERQVDQLMQPPHTLLFIEPANCPSCCSLHSFLLSPQKRLLQTSAARSSRSHIQCVVSTSNPSSDSSTVLCLSVKCTTAGNAKFS